ncbi:hypothetical protein [Paractinoplanes durhamensis]|uniref:Uncharacterized protein n=1 Tax=Paractinoplanes durhamensis TaxID=113563 RepID=A0ABQ3YRR4_9ACTN|nr:hypothetical protein [Actinoplanes durhamensis]GIE00273.1 hypothetical protein Adu01nite_16230 [Actinoplanes durhamensis]
MITRKRAIGAGAAVAFVAAIAGAVTTVAASPAAAIPASQSICSMPGFEFFSDASWITMLPSRSVTTTGATTLKVSATADIGVEAANNAEVRLGWSVNGAAPVEGVFGPANFASHANSWETRTSWALINVGAGTTTVQPYIRLSAPLLSPSAHILHRCFTIEATTA